MKGGDSASAASSGVKYTCPQRTSLTGHENPSLNTDKIEAIVAGYYRINYQNILFFICGV
jgi:hypothetical protein